MLLARCDEGGDVKAHFGELNRLRQIMVGMGVIVDDEDYAAIVMGSLPDSYQPIISALDAAAGYSSKVVTAQELITAVNVEYEHRLLCNCHESDVPPFLFPYLHNQLRPTCLRTHSQTSVPFKNPFCIQNEASSWPRWIRSNIVFVL
jgi:hypothetical protein